MTMFIFYREDSISSQEISFGQDVDHSQPILARFGSRALFGDDEVPAGIPLVVEVDIRVLTECIMQGIHQARADYKKRIARKRKRGHYQSKDNSRRDRFCLNSSKE